jgi:hypothetical protein
MTSLPLVCANAPPKNEKDAPRRGEPRRHQRLIAALEYGFLFVVSKISGSIFWAAECRRSKLADEMERVRWER